MAKRELRANDFVLSISYDDGSTYNTIICLTSNGVTRATSAIESSTKCGTTSVPGATTIAIPFEGNVWLDPDAGETSMVDLISLMNNQTNFFFKMGVAVPGEGDYTHFGEGFLSQLDESYAVDAAATFSGTITPSNGLQTTFATS